MLDIEAFKGIRTPHHQFRDPPNVLLVTPRQYQFPEVKTARQAQQPAHGVSRPALIIRFEGPGQQGRGRRLKVDPVGVGSANPGFAYTQVLEKEQGANEVENP